MRLIDADALKNEMVIDLANTMRMQEMHKGDMAVRVLNKIDEAPTIEAEPVRHGENTTFITTDDVGKYQSRIIIRERNSQRGRMYYESDTKYGRWENEVEKYPEMYGYVPLSQVVCSICDRAQENETPYCPNCGAKMDGCDSA